MTPSAIQLLFGSLCLVSILQVSGSKSFVCRAGEELVDQFFTMEVILDTSSDFTCSANEQKDLGTLIQHESLIAALKLKDHLDILKEWKMKNATVCKDAERRRLSSNSALRRKLDDNGGLMYKGKSPELMKSVFRIC